MTRKLTRPGGFEPPASSSAGKRSIHLSYGRSLMLAERLGFEPRVDLSGLHALSRRAPSTARPPLLMSKTLPANGGRGIRTPMSLAARWISSPLPYQLGLALQDMSAADFTA